MISNCCGAVEKHSGLVCVCVCVCVYIRRLYIYKEIFEIHIIPVVLQISPHRLLSSAIRIRYTDGVSNLNSQIIILNFGIHARKNS